MLLCAMGLDVWSLVMTPPHWRLLPYCPTAANAPLSYDLFVGVVEAV